MDAYGNPITEFIVSDIMKEHMTQHPVDKYGKADVHGFMGSHKNKAVFRMVDANRSDMTQGVHCSRFPQLKKAALVQIIKQHYSGIVDDSRSKDDLCLLYEYALRHSNKFLRPVHAIFWRRMLT